jgi:hypothetical protein
LQKGAQRQLYPAHYHRSYELREPIEVRIHRDRIEIAGHPGPDASIRLQEPMATLDQMEGTYLLVGLGH